MVPFKTFLLEGGAGGRIPHPYNIAKSGEELINLFYEAQEYLEKGSGWLKLDGINMSVRVSDDTFVMDRGSAKDLDIEGIRPETLKDRFPDNPGFVSKATKLFQILDDSFESVKPILRKIGMITNPDLLLNVEYIEKKTNVVDYDKNIIAIHGMREIISQKYNGDKITSRQIEDVEYNEDYIAELIKKIQPFAEKRGFEVVGKPEVSIKSKLPNLSKILSQKISLNGEEKSLESWILGLNELPKNLITREKYLEIESGDKKELSTKEIDSYIIYYGSIKLGQEILNSMTSEFGDLTNQEGVIIKREDGTTYKITGNFIIKGLDSKFND
jgi:hypothetical protein